MALATYSDLKTAVANWLKRSDLTSNIPDFITLAETRFGREIRLRSMETVSTGSLTAGVNTLAVPADLLKLQKLTVNDGSADYDLEYFPPKNLTRYSSYSGRPRAFTTINRMYYIGPVPDTSYSYSLNYIAKVSALSDSNTTNTILSLAPDVYLYGALLEAEPFLKNDARIGLWLQAYQNAVEKLKEQDDQQQFPDESLVVRADVRL